MKRAYLKPTICTEQCFETGALGCGKMSSGDPGSWHFASPYDTFTGHLGSGFGGSASDNGTVGIGFGPGGTTASYAYSGLCGNWVQLAS